MKILDYLAVQNAEAGLSEIARALELSKSSCFNILSTLASGQFVVKDSQRATYRLGPKLVEIGTASRRNFSRRSFYRRQVRPLVDKIGVGCIVAQPLGDFSGIVVIDRILPALPHHEVVVPAVGERIPITAPAMGRALLSRYEDEEVLDILREVALPAPGGETAFLGQLRAIRRTGYATSQEEYRPGINAVATCVLGRRFDVTALLCLVGKTADLPEADLPALGQRLIGIARRIEASLSSADEAE